MAKKSTKPEAPSRPKLYVVRERLADEQPEPVFGDGQMLGVFLDRARAESALRAHDAARREEGDLSRLEGIWDVKQLYGMTDFERPVFLDWLTDADIPPPPDKLWDRKKNLWASWLGKLNRRQAAHLLKGLHRLEFFELIEVDLIDGKYPEGERDRWERGEYRFSDDEEE